MQELSAVGTADGEQPESEAAVLQPNRKVCCDLQVVVASLPVMPQV